MKSDKHLHHVSLADCTAWLYPTSPKGQEGNWVQTMPGKGFNVLLRLYGPLEPWFDKSWKPGDFELQQ